MTNKQKSEILITTLARGPIRSDQAYRIKTRPALMLQFLLTKILWTLN